MKPKAQNEHEDGLLEYLEDIIGTSKYKQPLEEASQVVEKLSEEKAEKLNRVRIVESEKKHLEPKKEEAEDFLRSENTLVKKRSILWQYEIADYETRAQAAETEVVSYHIYFLAQVCFPICFSSLHSASHNRWFVQTLITKRF
ncbi:hypothetical protein BKA69DRAFT_50558 [Paraphysoderma sedebokerense]|nr:hypothetical protein BKA69DRAFT_50558 [Paraphysoderma sedebokerense]